MGRYDDALTDFSRAIELDPSDDDYAAGLAEIHQLMDQAPETNRLSILATTASRGS